jgi:hypothetical protein
MLLVVAVPAALNQTVDRLSFAEAVVGDRLCSAQVVREGLFQVRDDLLDVDPNAAKDKDRNADGAKSTYARLLGVGEAAAYAQQHMQICLAEARKLPPPHDRIFGELAEWTAGRLA